MVCSSLSNAVNSLETPPLSSMIESVYILDGSSVYAVSQLCIKILYTVFIELLYSCIILSCQCDLVYIAVSIVIVECWFYNNPISSCHLLDIVLVHAATCEFSLADWL